MTIILPRLHRSTDYALRPVYGPKPARSALGTTRQPNSRGGSHWAMEIAAGALSPLCARELVADIVRGGGEPLRAYIPMLGIEVGPIGAPVVDGGDQLGDTLVTTGWTPQTAIRKGWLFNLLFEDVTPSLHLVSGEVIANAAGEATINFWPPMRDIPADGLTMEWAEPFIEGSIDEGGDQESGLLKAIQVGNFVIEEDD